jgi:LuxR family maltose regulon positive regulatory protein
MELLARRVLLRPKFTMPHQRTCLISRPRLTAQIDPKEGGIVTLISAPAGFGKTTLVAEWAMEKKRRTAWLSLDEADNDPVRFWRYIVASLRTVAADFGQDLITALEQGPAADWEFIVSLLVDGISRFETAMTLVLDDYHLINASAIHASLSFLLNHQPPQLHVIIISRADPPLALARLRVQGRLQDIRASDLRFTAGEMEAFFNCTVPSELAPMAIKTFSERIEGWAAGLQLAVLSLKELSAADAARFSKAFGGTQRYVLNFLLEEVLDHQEPHIQQFLLYTSVLHNLTPQLCQAVTGYPDSAQILARLAEEELFIEPLDEIGQWYRYHRLFASAMRGHLEQTEPERIPELRRKAAAWYAERKAGEELPLSLQPAFVTLSYPIDPELDDLYLDSLTERELEILGLIAQGLSNQQIADQLVISVGTVKGHITHILSKLNAQSRTDAVARALHLGLLNP